MSTTVQSDASRPPREWQPTMYDLPSDDYVLPGIPDKFCFSQAKLLDETFRLPNQPDSILPVAMNLNENSRCYDLYGATGYINLDRFALIGLVRFYKRGFTQPNYVIRQQGEAPLLAVELLAAKTNDGERDQLLRDLINTPPQWAKLTRERSVPYYVLFSERAKRMSVFRLDRDRERYDEVPEQGERLWLAEAGLGVCLWQGCYRGQDRLWLRGCDAQGKYFPTLAERAERLAEKLRQLGHNPDQV